MKTDVLRQSSAGLAAGLAFFLGCARPSAQPEQPKAVVAPPPAALIAQAAPVAPPPEAAVSAPASADAADTNAPAILERIPPSSQPENIPMSPGLAEVVKLAQAGVGEEVILAYIEKYSAQFNVGADQILYLNDLGVSSTVITSMLKHDGNAEPAVANAAPLVVQTQAVSNLPQSQIVEQPPQPAPQVVATAVAPPPTSPEVSYFYDTLSPYGSWIYLSGYGWCWQPTVAVSVPTWRPYCDRGRWYWSDAGWYWSSDYSWGWAAFHYGRWYRHPGSGWVWAPGTVWGPSWVSWRYSDGYCGWAPLPPEAHFVSGVGFRFHGRHVSIGFDFGLHDYHYSFVHINNFCDYAPYRYVVPHHQVRNFYRNTTVINNYTVNNNTFINRGVGRETIARSSQTRIREVAVREAPVRNLASVRGDRIEREGNQTVVYRPQLPKTPPAVRSTQFANRPGARAAATVARNSSGSSQPAAVGRQPGAVAARRAESNPGVAQPARVAPETRNGREVRTPRGNLPASREQTAPGNETAPRQSQPNANPAPSRQPNASPAPNRQPNANPAPNRQPRSNNSPLFGPSTGNAVAQQNEGAARPALRQHNTATEARILSQNNNPTPTTRVAPPNNSFAAPRAVPQNRPQSATAATSPPARTYQAPAAAQRPQVYAVPRSDSGRAVPEYRPMSPRQTEQTSPRYTAPAPQDSRPVTRSYSSPQPRSEVSRPAPSGTGRASRSESAPARADRNR